MNDKWIIDATMPTPEGTLCFCPVELDEHGEAANILTGLSYVSDRPPATGKCIGAFHNDGQEAVEKWIENNRAAYEHACGAKP